MPSFGPNTTRMHLDRIFPFIATSPSPVLDFVQAPVMLYAYVILPVLYFALWIFIVTYVISLPLSKERKRMRTFAAKLTFENAFAIVRHVEQRALKHNVSTSLYVILLGTPLVAMLCVIYGHHLLSFSVYDSPFQVFASLYGLIFAYAGLFITTLGFHSLFTNIYPLLFALIALNILLSIGFLGTLFVLYFRIIFQVIHHTIRWYVISIGIFTILQPFIFRFLRFDVLHFIGFTANANPFFGYNSTYLLALLLPCAMYLIIVMVIYRWKHKRQSWTAGLHLGLLFLALLAADIH